VEEVSLEDCDDMFSAFSGFRPMCKIGLSDQSDDDLEGDVGEFEDDYGSESEYSATDGLEHWCAAEYRSSFLDTFHQHKSLCHSEDYDELARLFSALELYSDSECTDCETPVPSANKVSYSIEFMLSLRDGVTAKPDFLSYHLPYYLQKDYTHPQQENEILTTPKKWKK